MSPRIGLYGGTFNPIHLGHLRAAEEVVEALDLERMLFVPSAEPPHKRAEPGDALAPASERLAWVHLAVRGNPRFAVDPLEVERSGPSFTVETLEAIGSRLGGAAPVFTVGRDAFVEMGSWREPRRIFTLADVAVTTRPPASSGSLSSWLPDCVRGDVELAADGRSARHRRAGTWIRLVEITPLDISSSDVRERLRTGRSTRYLLPEDVRAAVEASGVYRQAKEEDDA